MLTDTEIEFIRQSVRAAADRCLLDLLQTSHGAYAMTKARDSADRVMPSDAAAVRAARRATFHVPADATLVVHQLGFQKAGVKVLPGALCEAGSGHRLGGWGAVE